MLAVKLAGLGVALPARIVTSAELETRMGLATGWIEKATGVRERRRAVRESSMSLAVEAGRMALERASLAPAAVDLLVFAATSRRQMIPCTAALLQRELGMPEGSSFAFDVDATCLSFLVALWNAAHWIRSGSCRCALIVSSETPGPSLNPEEPESAVLMGDGAAAAVLVGCADGSQIRAARFATYSSGADFTCLPGAGTLHHPNDPRTTPNMNLFRMNGPAVFKKALQLLPLFVEQFLGETGWDQAEVDAVVPHQASQPGVELLVKRCGFRREQLVLNLATRGNCVAASIPIALAEAVHDRRIGRGQKVVLVGSGAGFSLGAVALVF